jgi:hypothetical protein
MKKKLLRVTGPSFVAGAVWSKVNRQWFIAGPIAPILMWMHGLSRDQIASELKRRKFTWEWLDYKTPESNESKK